MLSQIKGFFEQHLMPGAGADAAGDDHQLRLAVAVLLLEMSRMDEPVQAAECAAVEDAVRQRFDLTPEETRELLDLAEAERLDATDYFQFTALINAHYGPPQRAALVEHLWRVAYADSALSPFEEHLVRKVSQLLHVPHPAFIAAKHSANPGE